MKKIVLLLLLWIMAIIAGSCSGNSGLVTPSTGIDDLKASGDNSGRVFLGLYNVQLDPATSNASVEIDREGAGHMSVKKYLSGWPCSSCLKLSNIQFLPGNQVSLDIKIIHPVNMPIYTVFDPRVIAIFPANETFSGAGVSYALLNRDGLTALWDNPNIPGYINGFKAFNKDEPRRPFGPGDSFTENFLVQLPSGSFKFDIAVDASWEPNDGVNFPLTMNSLEVINLQGNVDWGLTDVGGSAPVTVSMYDYQGVSTIKSVQVYSDNLFNGAVALSFFSGDDNNAVYGGTITNQKNALPGTYNVLVRVTDTKAPNYAYDFSAYTVIPATVISSHVEITLEEDQDYKTPGNYYVFNAYSGRADHTVINFFNTSGPWDFRPLEFTGTGRKTILATSDPEISTWVGNFPTAEYIVKNDGSFGGTSALYYQAEKHDFAKNTLMPLGLYETEYLNGAVVFTGTILGFPYPYNTSSSFSRTYKAGLLMSIKYDTQALGKGVCIVPWNGGTAKTALLMRTVMTGSYIVQIGKILMYEWIDDDGNTLAIVTAANMAGETANWNESTYDITGAGGILAMNESHRQ